MFKPFRELLIILFVIDFNTIRIDKTRFTYTVQAGDTCRKIAASLDVSVISIIKINDLNEECSDIYAGQVLSIHYSTATPYRMPGTVTSNIVIECEREIYLVKQGDTLDSLADKYKTSIEAISFFNGLTNDM